MSNLYVREYSIKCSCDGVEMSSVPGDEVLVATIKGRCPAIQEGFLTYAACDKDGLEIVSGINLKSIHSFRTEAVKSDK
ncbi:hypothetical protein F0331_06405 [Klebsiella variicola]|nr:hypothetical protein F0331_06405 [Klebsiella variicola]